MALFRKPPYRPTVRVRWISTKGASRQGALDASLDALTVSSAATLALQGAAAITLGNVTTSSAGSLLSNFTTEALINNTGTILASVSVHWSWWPAGRVGSFGAITPVEGSGTTSGAGLLTITGVPGGAGLLMVSSRVTDATDDAVYYQAGTAV